MEHLADMMEACDGRTIFELLFFNLLKSLQFMVGGFACMVQIPESAVSQDL